MRHDQSAAECFVDIERDGVLRRVGHDLRLRVMRFWVEVTPERVEAFFDPASLVVDCALVEGHEDRRSLSDKDKQQIAESVANEVLRATKFSSIAFVSKAIAHNEADSSAVVTGTVELCGVKKDVRVRVDARGEQHYAEVILDQREFGIRPFSAMLGALRVRPNVRVSLRVPRAT